jgi:hypothetical protein
LSVKIQNPHIKFQKQIKLQNPPVKIQNQPKIQNPHIKIQNFFALNAKRLKNKFVFLAYFHCRLKT